MNGSIFQLDLTTRNVTLLRSERSPLFGLQIYDPHKQQGIENAIFYIHTKQRKDFLHVTSVFAKQNMLDKHSSKSYFQLTPSEINLTFHDNGDSQVCVYLPGTGVVSVKYNG